MYDEFVKYINHSKEANNIISDICERIKCSVDFYSREEEIVLSNFCDWIRGDYEENNENDTLSGLFFCVNKSLWEKIEVVAKENLPLLYFPHKKYADMVCVCFDGDFTKGL